MASQVQSELDVNIRPASGTFVFGVAIFLSAFLLFEVQPLIAKMILPWFGGSASVWTVCLLFFQTTLLAGYAYAHLVSKLTGRMQAAVHVALLAVSLAALPIIPNAAWKPQSAGDPSWRILLLLALTVGLPYFVLSSTSPLLQAWWTGKNSPTFQNQSGWGNHKPTLPRAVRVGHPSPYRFYALSNAGSMLALLSYPVVVEPRVRTHTQAMGWSAAYAAVAILCAWIAVSVRNTTPAAVPEGTVAERPSWRLRALWMTLAAIASALLLAITNHISQNIAAVPFLWIAPLSLYLCSFILCFDSARWYKRSIFLRLLAVTLGGMTYALSDQFGRTPIVILVPMFCAFLFVCCMFCHGELARLKPEPRYLTGFYLMVSLGGALGALFVALIAPRVFDSLIELPIAIGACAIMAVVVVARDPEGVFRPSARRVQPVVVVIALMAAAIVTSLAVSARENNNYTRIKSRNFYGILRVYDKLATLMVEKIPDPVHLFDPPDPRYRELVNGTINHGLQFMTPSMRHFATTYYSTNSGVGVALLQEGKRGPLRVGVIGLGAGTLAAYGRWGDSYRFYDINPLVINVANHEFTFLRDSLARVDIVPGDARLSLEREKGDDFDLLAVDAFSGDSIPVHLLTLEAFELYFKQVKPTGVLAVHVSNKYLDLIPVVRGAAERLGKKAVVVDNGPDDNQEIFAATWVLVSAQELPYQMELMKAGEVTVSEGPRVIWTDNYSSLWRLVKVGED
jgi:hypothetical protein